MLEQIILFLILIFGLITLFMFRPTEKEKSYVWAAKGRKPFKKY